MEDVGFLQQIARPRANFYAGPLRYLDLPTQRRGVAHRPQIVDRGLHDSASGITFAKDLEFGRRTGDTTLSVRIAHPQIAQRSEGELLFKVDDIAQITGMFGQFP